MLRVRLTEKDELQLVWPVLVEVGRSPDDPLELVITLTWRWTIAALNLRASLADDRVGPLYYQARVFGPVTITRLPLGRR